MFGFFKSKAGVFVISLVLLVITLTLVAVSGKPKRAENTEPVPAKEEPPPTVAPVNTVPDTILKTNTSVEQMRTKSTTDVRNENGVSVMHRRTPMKSESASQRPPEPENPNNTSAGGTGDQKITEGLRIKPLARRQTSEVQNDQTGSRATPHVQSPATSKSASDKDARFAPFGRLIKCELVITIDSTSEQTPVVALVAEDQYWNGELIIPAGTEVHGTARVDRERDRIFTGSQWVLILPRQGRALNGRELTLTGNALDRDDPKGQGMTWGITDGSYGLKGHVIKSTEANDIKLFAATFLASAGGALQDTSTSAFGQVTPQASSKNAALAGTQAVLNRYSDMLLTEIRKNGVYIRVPAGKQFYLYVTETLMPDKAAVAASAGAVTDLKTDQTKEGTAR